jgi:hypothetical protein
MSDPGTDDVYEALVDAEDHCGFSFLWRAECQIT